MNDSGEESGPDEVEGRNDEPGCGEEINFALRAPLMAKWGAAKRARPWSLPFTMDLLQDGFSDFMHSLSN
jgi:hypothetical protein